MGAKATIVATALNNEGFAYGIAMGGPASTGAELARGCDGLGGCVDRGNGCARSKGRFVGIGMSGRDALVVNCLGGRSGVSVKVLLSVPSSKVLTKLSVVKGYIGSSAIDIGSTLSAGRIFLLIASSAGTSTCGNRGLAFLCAGKGGTVASLRSSSGVVVGTAVGMTGSCLGGVWV